jgi:hypothetical protein
VVHVRAVEAIAVLHERLAPELLFRRDQARRVAMHLDRRRVLEPLVVDDREPVAGVVEDVDERIAFQGLGDPERVEELGLVAGVGEDFQAAIAVAGRMKMSRSLVLRAMPV